MPGSYYVVKDTFDERDVLYTGHLEVESVKHVAPIVSDLRPWCSSVEDQRNTNSCTGNAIVGALEYDENVLSQKFVDLSRLFVYYNERMIEGTVSQDEGAAIRDGIKAIATYGVCEESLWPFDEHKVLLKPSMEAYQEATRRKALSYQRVDQTHEALMHVLGVAKRPVVLGIQIYESFESVTVEKTGIVPMPSHHERCLGGHAVLAVGYDAQRHVYFGRNSWSDQWGIHGYFEIPFDYLIRQDLASDFWVVSRIS